MSEEKMVELLQSALDKGGVRDKVTPLVGFEYSF